MHFGTHCFPPTESFQRGLDTCFPSWGGLATSQWFFERTTGAPPADLLSLSEGGAEVAGMALTYRWLRLGHGPEIVIAIISGAWTLPAARRRGAFSKLLNDGLKVAQGNGAAIMVAFATTENASFRRMTEAGFSAVRTQYLITSAERTEPCDRWRSVALDGEEAAELFSLRSTATSAVNRIQYPSPAAWISQFLKRPTPCELLRSGEDHWAIIELATDTDRLLLLHAPDRAVTLTSLAARAASHQRKLFCFDMSDIDETVWIALGFEVARGGMMVRAADTTALAEALGLDQTPFETSSELIHPHSPWFMGHWEIQGGDRM